MAGYGHTYRGGYTTCNGGALRSEEWTKTSYTSDPTCQSVFIDGEGRRKPIISYSLDGNTTEYYVTRTEIVEIPYMTEYKQSTPIKVEASRDYGGVEGKRNRPLSPEKWRKSSSPVRYHTEEKWVTPSSPVRHHVEKKWVRPSSPVRCHTEEKWIRPSSPVRYHTEEKWIRPSSPVRYHTEEKWIRPSSPVRYHAEEKWIRPSSPVLSHSAEKWVKPSSPVLSNRPSSPVEERPQQVEDFITKIQIQASRPHKFSPQSATYLHQAPNSSAGYGDQGGSWSKGQQPNLIQPTSDISTAMEYLIEAAKPCSAINAPPPSRYSMPAPPAGPKRDGYPTTIDSREAQRRYGNGGLNVSTSRPIDYHGRTIDSREAAGKYGGTTV